ncbi:MAG: aminotransferase class I/II-fold pyridoxal phosphate-dependent enzyme [Candidatus Latescibacteria bacterium]|jgi:cystathionine gamma-synthase|nr:aminotransferase class I/II-fold pyridoxal phosphate-dependent enzyme [Candidatus Latescibacterota bacterium]
MKHNISTDCIHAGEDRVKPHDSITTPIFQSATFVFNNSEDIRRYTQKEHFRYEYGRYGNPTQRAAEKKLAILGGAESAVLFASGMSAIINTLLAVLKAGDHMIITDDAYGKTLAFVKSWLPNWGINTTIVKMDDYNAIEKAIKHNTRMFFSESPTNPYLNIMDFSKLRDIKSRHPEILVISDSTFATPYNQKPLELGADIVIHSATKYLSGHNDILAGVVLGSEKLVEEIVGFQKIMGGVIDPHCAYLLIRGLKTFSVRMERLNSSGEKVARWLESHPKIRRCYYPSLESHPHHDVAKREMNGYGAVSTFELEGDLEDSNRLLDNLKLCYIGPSLGGCETLITHPATVTYYNCTREERYELGILDNLFRLSVGLEDPEDIIADLDQAIKAVFK